MIRTIQLKDKERWKKLYIGYADFYKVEMNEKILETVWEWLNDTNHELKGIGYEADGKIVGLAHYRKLLSPLKGKYIGYLDDIFVDPEYRGQKIGEKLLNKIKEISKANDWNLVRWQTDEDNLTAKKLYDKVATKTKKNVYELT
jgi:GNAT superfamily N-acetyltransferase